MVELEQYKFTVNQYKEPMKELGVSLALSHKHEQIKELESEMREEGFWNDPDKAQEVTRKVKNLKDTVSAYHALELTLDDVSTMIELGNEENDASVIPDIEELNSPSFYHVVRTVLFLRFESRTPMPLL